jgi:hypothetical protein
MEACLGNMTICLGASGETMATPRMTPDGRLDTAAGILFRLWFLGRQMADGCNTDLDRATLRRRMERLRARLVPVA